MSDFTYRIPLSRPLTWQELDDNWERTKDLQTQMQGQLDAVTIQAQQAAQARAAAEASQSAAATSASQALSYRNAAQAHANAAYNNGFRAAEVAFAALSGTYVAKVEKIRDQALVHQLTAKGSAAAAALAAAEAMAAVGNKMPVLIQPQVITDNITIPTGYNAAWVGDVYVQPGVTVEGQGTAVLRGL